MIKKLKWSKEFHRCSYVPKWEQQERERESNTPSEEQKATVVHLSLIIFFLESVYANCNAVFHIVISPKIPRKNIEEIIHTVFFTMAYFCLARVYVEQHRWLDSPVSYGQWFVSVYVTCCFMLTTKMWFLDWHSQSRDSHRWRYKKVTTANYCCR
jgi:hypothetical protein